MDESSYLNPSSIRQQCQQMQETLKGDIEKLEILENCLDNFISNEEIKSDSFDNLKQHIGDYKLIIQLISTVHKSDILDCSTLSGAVGAEILDGSIIIPNKKEEKIKWKENEETAQSMRNEAGNFLPWFPSTFSCYMEAANIYSKLAETSRKLYEKWKEKEKEYDDIETATCNLFSASGEIRALINNGISGISNAFQNGNYVPSVSAIWRRNVNDYKVDMVKTELLYLGYSEQEIGILYHKKVNLTMTDIIFLKATERPENVERIFLSEDKKAIFYNGRIYYIDVPTNEVTIGPVWNLDESRTLTKWDFDVAAGALGISLEGIEKKEIRTSDYQYRLVSPSLDLSNKNMTGAMGMSLLIGIEEFAVSSLDHTEVILNFESTEEMRVGRVQIAVGNFQTRYKYANINYNVPINTYRNQSDWATYKLASDQAMYAYWVATGTLPPDLSKTYTLTGNLDERHKDALISGYLSYSDNGQLQYTPLIYSGDRAYVATCQQFTGNNVDIVLDISDKLSTPTVVDDEVMELLEQAIVYDYSK